ncbi:hypothetical protein [Aureimonas psammosilenae]|uniref:hypothetical protein n=1 Tax=Aureimonas psammosilenae TaxID=2495496 RepID=UPI001260F92D|nr:hypothetical protein [Aureimonas psammosilenae]
MSSVEARLQSENVRLREEREELEERVRQLEEALRPTRTLPTDWKLSAQETRFVLALLARDVVPFHAMNEAIRVSQHAFCENHCHVVAGRVRRKVEGVMAIETVRQRGFRLRDRQRVAEMVA